MRMYGYWEGKYVSVCKACGKLGGSGGGNVFIRRNLVKSGTVFTQAYFTIYCVIKAFIIDLHVKKNSQHIQGGPGPPPHLKETLITLIYPI